MEHWYETVTIGNDIIALVNKIGCKCRGRIEIERGNNINVIEFFSDETGKWQNTTTHKLLTGKGE